MEGNARVEAQDSIVDNRFQVMEAVNCPNLAGKKENGMRLFLLCAGAELVLFRRIILEEH